MTIRQLYELQSLEQDVAAREEALNKARAAIGEGPALERAKENLAAAQASLNATRAEQRTTDDAIADITAKIMVANESLFSGRVKNPKELQNLQHELTMLQSQRNPLEEKDLSLMEQVEADQKAAELRESELSAVEVRWLAEQKALQTEIASSQQVADALKVKRAAAVAAIPAGEMVIYQQLRQTRGWGIARVEQGTCSRCRLSLSTAEVQRARAGQQVNCSSCGRLLFFD